MGKNPQKMVSIAPWQSQKLEKLKERNFKDGSKWLQKERTADQRRKYIVQEETVEQASIIYGSKSYPVTRK